MKTLRIWIRDLLVLLAAAQVLFHVLLKVFPGNGLFAKIQDFLYPDPEFLRFATVTGIAIIFAFLSYYGQKAGGRVKRAAIETRAVRNKSFTKESMDNKKTYRQMIAAQGYLKD